MKLTSFIKKLIPFVSVGTCFKDEERDALRYICIRKDKVFATNGAISVQTDLSEDEICPRRWDALLKPECLESAFLFSKNKSIIVTKNKRNCVEYSAIANKDGGNTIVIEDFVLHGTIYPKNIDSFIPQSDPVKVIEISSELLKKVAELCEVGDIKLSFYEGDKTPVSFEIFDGDRVYKGIVMPIIREVPTDIQNVEV